MARAANSNADFLGVGVNKQDLVGLGEGGGGKGRVMKLHRNSDYVIYIKPFWIKIYLPRFQSYLKGIWSIYIER